MPDGAARHSGNLHLASRNVDYCCGGSPRWVDHVQAFSFLLSSARKAGSIQTCMTWPGCSTTGVGSTRESQNSSTLEASTASASVAIPKRNRTIWRTEEEIATAVLSDNQRTGLAAEFGMYPPHQNRKDGANSKLIPAGFERVPLGKCRDSSLDSLLDGCAHEMYLRIGRKDADRSTLLVHEIRRREVEETILPGSQLGLDFRAFAQCRR